MRTPSAQAKATLAHHPFPLQPDSAEKPSLATPSPSLSGPAQRAFEITKDGRRPDGSWIKIHLGPGNITLLKERIFEHNPNSDHKYPKNSEYDQKREISPHYY
ncbi:MAG: hypothetical protein M1813_005430 [Trichoglossum hirsutum]|nr:MAG: hypothetical protein M1813_005430 [Trichoglossum hirsutum]